MVGRAVRMSQTDIAMLRLFYRLAAGHDIQISMLFHYYKYNESKSYILYYFHMWNSRWYLALAINCNLIMHRISARKASYFLFIAYIHFQK